MNKTATRPRFKPSEWRVVGQLRHAGITYGTNEPLPNLTLDQAEMYAAQGTLMRIGINLRPQEFLDATDGMILQRVLDEQPDAEFLDEVTECARQTSRSKVLELALMIAARGARATRPAR